MIMFKARKQESLLHYARNPRRGMRMGATVARVGIRYLPLPSFSFTRCDSDITVCVAEAATNLYL